MSALLLSTTESICTVLAAEPVIAAAVNQITIDSRSIIPGAVFVALKGERFDGHAFVADALAKGAVAAIVSEPVDGVDKDRLIAVKNTEAALQQLGQAARALSKAQFIGVTGSVGKTGCKEMLACALKSCGRIYATHGNLNNHLGVPLTLANLPVDVDFAIIEMGMNHAGEIAQLSGWARPHVSIITTVDAVHIEFFDSVEAIADAKSEIFSGMGGQGVAVLNADNPHYLRMFAAAEAAGLDRILSFGSQENALCYLRRYQLEGLESRVDAVISGTPVTYRMGAIGRHWGLMSVAVLAIADALGADLAKAAAALQYFNEPDGRGRIEELPVKGGHLRLVDDSYNASPISIAGAIEKMAELRGAYEPTPRVLVVLGDMLELGDESHALHVGLAPTLVNNQIDLVFAAGRFMKALYDTIPEAMRGDYDETALGLAPKVVRRLQGNDLVLVKGSHGSRMGEVSAAIRARAVDAESVN